MFCGKEGKEYSVAITGTGKRPMPVYLITEVKFEVCDGCLPDTQASFTCRPFKEENEIESSETA